MSTLPIKRLYYNKPQLETYHIGAHRTYCIWGRGTGKTTNALALHFARLVTEMPRGLFALVGVSYAQILGRVLPGLIQGWERLGYQRNVHFFVRKFAPEKYGWKRSYFCPEEASHIIHWWTGAVIVFVSQDRPSLANGLSFDGMGGDEARFLNYDQMFTTDMPTDHRGAWLFDFEPQSLSESEKTKILTIAAYLSELHRKKYNASTSQKVVYQRQITRYEKVYNQLRKGKVFFSMASTLENIYALGAEAIQTMKKTMPKKRFEAAVLNLKRKQVDVGFYALFDPNKLGYYGDNHSFLDDPRFLIGSERDCRWDKYHDPKRPLDIGADFGGYFNGCVVGQAFRQNNYRILNSFWVEHPDTSEAVMKQIAHYYRFTECKEIHFYHDHTAYDKPKREGVQDGISYLEEWENAAKRYGWVLRPIFIGHTQSPNSRYLLWHRTFKNDPELARFQYHQATCQDLETAIQLTALKEGKDGAFQKDKSTEKPDKSGNFPLPQQHAPHLTDALDTLWVGTQFHKVSSQRGWKMPEPMIG